MAFNFDRIFDASAKVVDDAKNAAVDLAQKSKRQAELLNAQNKLSKAERQLGALVYSLHKNDEQNPELMQKYIAAIDAISAEIEQLKAEPVVEAAPAAAAQPQPAPQARACAVCGKEVKEDALFCDGCGAQL